MYRQAILLGGAVLLGFVGGGAVLYASTAGAANAEAKASIKASPIPVAASMAVGTAVVVCRGPLVATADDGGPWLTGSKAPHRPGKDGKDLQPGQCALQNRALAPAESALLRFWEYNRDGHDADPPWRLNAQPHLRNIVPFLAQCAASERCVLSVRAKPEKDKGKHLWWVTDWDRNDIRVQYNDPKPQKVTVVPATKSPPKKKTKRKSSR